MIENEILTNDVKSDLDLTNSMGTNQNQRVEQFQAIGSELFKQKTDTQTELREIDLFLRQHYIKVSKKKINGITKNVTEVLPLPNSQPLISDEGRYRILQSVETYLNPMGVLGNLQEDKILLMVREFSNQLACWLVAEYKIYNIRRLSDIPIIVNRVRDRVYIFLTRSRDGRESQITGGSTVSEVITPPQPSKGFFGLFKK